MGEGGDVKGFFKKGIANCAQGLVSTFMGFSQDEELFELVKHQDGDQLSIKERSPYTTVGAVPDELLFYCASASPTPVPSLSLIKTNSPR